MIVRHIIPLILILLLPIDTFAQDTVDNDRYISECYVNTVCPKAKVRKVRKGILVITDSIGIRAANPFTYNRTSLVRYASTVNNYKDSLDKSIRIFCMPIPTASAYYTPDIARDWTDDQCKAINTIFSALDSSISPVNIYTELGRHAAEPIYSRTDHHWAPLGAFYAARRFAKIAQVPFYGLKNYDTISMSGYYGTMPMYSRDKRVKQTRENFVYYVPREAEYTTYYTNFKIDKQSHQVISEGEEHEGNFFVHSLVNKQKPTSSYCVFGGGDYKLIKVKTAVNNGRHLMILKDSFGNALTAYLLSSFEEIHVVDCRYFSRNLKAYVAENNITDILFANNLTHACMDRTTDTYMQYLVQEPINDSIPEETF